MKGSVGRRLARGLSLIMAVVAGSSLAAPGPVAYWSFNEGSGNTLHDSSGNGNNGRIAGAQWSQGITGKALLFVGTADTVIVPDASSLRPSEMTVETWVYADSFLLSPSGIFVSKENGSRASYRLQMNMSLGVAQFVTYNTWGNECRNTTVLANHQWHHLAGVWASESLKIYLDGKLEGSGARSGSVSYSSEPLLMGICSNGSTSASFKGKIDEVRIYNYQESADSISAHYNAVVPWPALANPANGAIDRPLAVTLSWFGISGATGYQLQVSSDSAFTGSLFFQSSTTASNAPVTGLANGTVYFWRVSARRGSAASPWSGVWKFTTIPTVPQVPVLASPANGAGGQPSASLNLIWNTASGASTYSLQISTTSSFATTFSNRDGLTGTTTSIAGLNGNTRYYWRMNAANSGGTSAWSGSWSFTTAAIPLPSAPTLASPANEGGVHLIASLNLIWNPASGAMTYGLQVSTISSFTTTFSNFVGLTGTTTTITGLSWYTVYYWRVNAVNNSGASAWSAAWSFVTLPIEPSSPTLLSPANGTTDQPTASTLYWNASSGASSYGVRLSTSSSFSTTVINQAGISATSLAISGLANYRLYYWEVNADNAGATSSWSPAWSFTTVQVAPPPAPGLAAPANGAAAQPNRMTFYWGATTGADSYRLQVSTNSSFSSTVVNHAGITGTSATEFFPRGIRYFWRMNAKNAGGSGPWSSTWNFDVAVSTLSVNGEAAQPSFGVRNGMLSYSLVHPSRVEISLFAINGRLAFSMDETKGAGCYHLPLHKTALPAGVYVLHFKSGALNETRSVLMTR